MKYAENLSILKNSLAEKRYFSYTAKGELKRKLYSGGEKANILVKGGISMGKLKEIRIQKGLTIRELANKSNVSYSYISELENLNKSNPSKETMDKLAKALEITVAELFY
ncbi:MAG: helix-turn-helix domain-containing protein [Clostridium paraputrificum]